MKKRRNYAKKKKIKIIVLYACIFFFYMLKCGEGTGRVKIFSSQSARALKVVIITILQSYQKRKHLLRITKYFAHTHARKHARARA